MRCRNAVVLDPCQTNPTPGKAPIASIDAISSAASKTTRFFPAALPVATVTVSGKRSMNSRIAIENLESARVAGDAVTCQTLALCQSIGQPGRADFARRRVSAQITDPPTLPAGQDRHDSARLDPCLCVQVALHGLARHSQGCCNLRIVQALASQRKSAGGIGLQASGLPAFRP